MKRLLYFFVLSFLSLPSFGLFCFVDDQDEYHCFENETGLVYYLGYKDRVDCGSCGSGGGCTNCVKITPAECQQLKTDIKGTLEASTILISMLERTNEQATMDIMQTRNAIEQLKEEGDQFRILSNPDVSNDKKGQFGNTTPDPSVYWDWAKSFYPGGQYFAYVTPAQQFVRASENTLYNYYNESVKPALDQMDAFTSSALTELQAISMDVNLLNGDFNQVSNILSSVSCEPCSTGSGGGGSGEGEGTGSIGCDCLKCAQAIIDYLDPQLQFLKEKIGDISNMVFTIKSDVSQFGRWMSDANDFKRNGTAYDYREEGVEIFNSGPSSAGGFSLGDYTSFNWFQRIEFLLAGIYGIFNTNGVSEAEFSEDQQDEADDVYKGISNNVGRLSAIVSSLESMSSSLASARDRLNPLKGYNYSSAPDKIVLFEHFDVPNPMGDKDLASVPQLYIDLGTPHDGFKFIDVIDAAHDITTVVWILLSCVVVIMSFYWFVLFVFKLIALYTKLYVAWCQTHFPA